jgi:predicted phosphodiesterase
LILGGCLSSACLEFSPFETDLGEGERNQTARNLQALSEREPNEARFRFAVISDSHQYYEELCDLTEVLNARGDLSFVVHLGDMTQMGLRQEFRWTLECLQQLTLPFLTAAGNHDLLSNGAEVYAEMFGPLEYTFDFAHVRFVVFDGNYVESGKPEADLTWLTAATRPPATGSRVIVLGHQLPPSPRYSELLKDHAVWVQITAHWHRFASGEVGTVLTLEPGAVSASQWLLVSVDDDQASAQFCTANACVEPP